MIPGKDKGTTPSPLQNEQVVINVKRFDSAGLQVTPTKKAQKGGKTAPEVEFGVVSGDELTMHSMHT